MPWARDAVGAEVEASIKSARSLLTVMTRAMDGGMDEDRIAVAASPISSDAIAGTVTVILTKLVAADVIAVAIGSTIDAGTVTAKTQEPQITQSP